MNTTQKREDVSHEKFGRIGFRPFWVLKLSILLRAVHQIGAAVFLTVFLLEDMVVVPLLYLLLGTFSGLALLITEWMRHRQIFREISGIGTLVKLILLGLAYHHILPQTVTVISAFMLASICSHAPKIYRHRLLF